MVRWKWIAATTTCLLVIAGCAAQEMSGDEEAVAVEPDEELEERTDQAIEESKGLEFSVIVDDESRGELSDLGMVRIDDDRVSCDIEGGMWTSVFDVDAADLVVSNCCDRGGACLTTLTFVDDESHLAMTGRNLETRDFSPDGRRVTVVAAATSGGAVPALAIADVEDLRRQAVPVDEAPPIIPADEGADLAAWQLEARALHKLEGLSARALDEARGDCEEGHHLPTLIELAEEGQPISSELDLYFERWLDDGDLLLSTGDDGPGGTAIVLEQPSQCMVRTGFADDPQELSGIVHVPDGFRFEIFGVNRFTVGDESRVVVSGMVSQPRGGDAPDSPFSMGATVDGHDSAQVLHRLVNHQEIFWWLARGADPNLLDQVSPSAPRRYAEAWRQLVTIVIDGEGDEFAVELFPR